MAPTRFASLLLLAAFLVCGARPDFAAAPRKAAPHRESRRTGSRAASHGGKTGPPARVDQILSNTAGILWQISDTYFQRGDYEQLIRLGHLVEVMTPQFEQSYGDLSWLEWSGGNNADAIDELARGVRCNPDDYYLWDDMGDCYLLWMKQPALALPYYIRAASFYSTAAWVVYPSLAHAAEGVGDYTLAAIAWRTAKMKAAGDRSKLDAVAHNLPRVLKELARTGDEDSGQRAGEEAGRSTQPRSSLIP